MNPYPGLRDTFWAEYRPDHNMHFPSVLVAPNGSLCCATDYELCGILGREIVAMSS